MVFNSKLGRPRIKTNLEFTYKPPKMDGWNTLPDSPVQRQVRVRKGGPSLTAALQKRRIYPSLERQTPITSVIREQTSPAIVISLAVPPSVPRALTNEETFFTSKFAQTKNLAKLYRKRQQEAQVV